MLRILFGEGFPQSSATSTALLLVAGVAPLVGLWAFGWGAAALFAFYAVELALGFVAVVAKIAANDADADTATARPRAARWARAAAKPFAIVDLLPRYLVTAAVFAAAAIWHLVRHHGTATLGPLPLVGWATAAVLLLVAAQATSFLDHYLRGGERRRIDLGRLHTRANARLLLVQMPLLVALVLASLVADGRWLLTVVVLAKVVAEVRVHEAERTPSGWLDRIESFTGFGA